MLTLVFSIFFCLHNLVSSFVFSSHRIFVSNLFNIFRKWILQDIFCSHLILWDKLKHCLETFDNWLRCDSFIKSLVNLNDICNSLFHCWMSSQLNFNQCTRSAIHTSIMVLIMHLFWCQIKYDVRCIIKYFHFFSYTFKVYNHDIWRIVALHCQVLWFDVLMSNTLWMQKCDLF